MRLQKELIECRKQNLWGIKIETPEFNFFQWFVTLRGPKDTIWQDGQFIVILKFHDNEILQAPDVVFQTIPFHPNIDHNTGRVCLGALEQWQINFCVSNLLLTLQQLLFEPTHRYAINENASKLALKSPLQYDSIVADCVAQSQQYEADVNLPSTPLYNPRDTDHAIRQLITIRPKVTPSNMPLPPKQHNKLSYGDYLNSWRASGTTKTQPETNNTSPLLDILSGDIVTNADKNIDDEISRQLSEHQALMFGQFRNVPEKDGNLKKLETLKANKVKLVKDIYLNRCDPNGLNVAASSSPIDGVTSMNQLSFDDDNEEDIMDEFDTIEAKELLEWSHNLPS